MSIFKDVEDRLGFIVDKTFINTLADQVFEESPLAGAVLYALAKDASIPESAFVLPTTPWSVVTGATAFWGSWDTRVVLTLDDEGYWRCGMAVRFTPEEVLETFVELTVRSVGVND